MPKLFIIFLFAALYSCGQEVKKSESDPNVARLMNQFVPLVSFLDNPDSCRKALSFLDSATTLNNKCFSCYQNKIMFLNALKEHKKAILTNDTLIMLVPGAHDLYLTGGILCEINKDTISAARYFQKSLVICNTVLDTMSKTHRDYVMLVTNKAVNLVMLDERAQANKILKDLYDSQPDDPEYADLIKKEILSLMNKSKADLREGWMNPKKEMMEPEVVEQIISN